MRITINGAELDVPAGTTVTALATRLQIDLRIVTVAVNGQLLLVAEYAGTVLAAGDVVRTAKIIAGG